MEGELNVGDATSQELWRQLMSLQADIEAIKEAQVLLLKVLVNFPPGQTPQRWLHAVREKAFCELEMKLAAFSDTLPPPSSRSRPTPALVLPKAAPTQALSRLPRVPPPIPHVSSSPFRAQPNPGKSLKDTLLSFVRGHA